ncbi:hypothetical protein T190115A13A_80224 [Tenacibaculum sp. 190524A02b]|uniref:Uncharacterized protein n=1 Tax=Tenacibaculum vairaonense TaxID=3137860 RepID=A0ABP1FG52_9FLAO
MKEITLEDWKKEASDKFGSDKMNWEFKCPSCKEVQTLKEFNENNVEEPESKFYFSCIGRWVKDRGCSWTLGGLLQIHKTEVITLDNAKTPVMEFSK